MLKKIEDILAQCIEDIKAGRSSVEDCLAKYPSISKQLEPLLRVALKIQEPPDVKPSAVFKVRARVQLMEQIHARQAVTEWPWFRYIGQLQPILYKRRFKMVGIIIAIVLAISAAGGGTAYASQGSLPGDFLYPVKLGTEQARLVVATSDTAKAELYLAFANSRVEEMTALTERGRPENVGIAVNGYDKAMALAVEKMGEASGKGLEIADISGLVAEATQKHLSTLDEVMDTIPEEATEAQEAIARAIEVSQTGYENAVLALAGENPVSAMEINLSAMEGRLNRAKAKAETGEVDAAQVALGEFEELRDFGQEISQIAQGLGQGTLVVELVARAMEFHLEVLAIVYENVPEQAKEAIERSMEVSVEGYQGAVEALEEAGALGDIPEAPPIPQGLPDEVKDKLLKPEVPAMGRP